LRSQSAFEEDIVIAAGFSSRESIAKIPGHRFFSVP
jgi:hypothetical protein